MSETPAAPPYLDDLLDESPSKGGTCGPEGQAGALTCRAAEQIIAATTLVASGKTSPRPRQIVEPKGDPAWLGCTLPERTQLLDESHAPTNELSKTLTGKILRPELCG